MQNKVKLCCLHINQIYTEEKIKFLGFFGAEIATT